jgi:hypothetical protein
MGFETFLRDGSEHSSKDITREDVTVLQIIPVHKISLFVWKTRKIYGESVLDIKYILYFLSATPIPNIFLADSIYNIHIKEFVYSCKMVNNVIRSK